MKADLHLYLLRGIQFFISAEDRKGTQILIEIGDNAIYLPTETTPEIIVIEIEIEIETGNGIGVEKESGKGGSAEIMIDPAW
jgi:hypothetical protein